MKRYLFTFAILTTVLGASSQSLDKAALRAGYRQCFQRRTALDSFITLLENNGHHTPAEESYLGIAYGINIKNIDGMWSKYKVLVKAKNLLNSAVEHDSRDPELRFVRFSLEHHIPAFLCMSTHINEDLKALLAQPSFLDESPDLKAAAIDFILTTKRCSPEQTAALQQIMADAKKRMTAAK